MRAQPSFTILFAAAVVFLGLFGVVNPNFIWTASLFTAVWLLLMFAVTAAIICRGAAQAYWIGLALLGVSYFWLAMAADGGMRVYPDRRIWREPKLPTTQLLFWAEEYADAFRLDATGAADGQRNYSSSGMGIIVSRDPSEHFVQVGQCLFTLAFAILGGGMGSWIYRYQLRNEVVETLRDS